MSVLSTIITLCTTGGVLYLIVDKLFERRRNRAETNTVEISNGNEIADLYNKIDEIVERKTAPIKNELAEVKGRLEEIKSTWCCYKEGCKERVLYKKREDGICDLAAEAKKLKCK